MVPLITSLLSLASARSCMTSTSSMACSRTGMWGLARAQMQPPLRQHLTTASTRSDQLLRRYRRKDYQLQVRMQDLMAADNELANAFREAPMRLIPLVRGCAAAPPASIRCPDTPVMHSSRLRSKKP